MPGRARISVRIERWLRGDQILVVKKRASKSAHKEVIAKREFACERREPHLRGSVSIMAHHQGPTISPSNKPIVATTIYLHLVVIEGMHQITRDQAMWQ